MTQILRADAPLAGRKMLRAPPSPAEMDAPKEDTNSPGWVYKSGGGPVKAPASAAQEGEPLLPGRGE